MRGKRGTKGQKGQRFLTSPHARARVSRDSLPLLPLAAPTAPGHRHLDLEALLGFEALKRPQAALFPEPDRPVRPAHDRRARGRGGRRRG